MIIQTKQEIKILVEHRRKVIKEITTLLDEHKRCEVSDCKSCKDIAKLGFIYEMFTAKIRELRGVKTDISKIIDQQIKNEILTLRLLARSIEIVDNSSKKITQ